jgi:hypothetical protein
MNETVFDHQKTSYLASLWNTRYSLITLPKLFPLGIGQRAIHGSRLLRPPHLVSLLYEYRDAECESEKIP